MTETQTRPETFTCPAWCDQDHRPLETVEQRRARDAAVIAAMSPDERAWLEGLGSARLDRVSPTPGAEDDDVTGFHVAVQGRVLVPGEDSWTKDVEARVTIEQSVRHNGRVGPLRVCLHNPADELTPEQAETLAAMIIVAAAKARTLA